MHGEMCIGIFVKSMVEGGAAHVVRIVNPTCDKRFYNILCVQDGRIQPGDQLLAVDGRSLDGCKQEE